MERKQLVIFPSGLLSPKDKERLAKNGFCPIECDDPQNVVTPMPDSVVGNPLLIAALDAMQDSATKARFVDSMKKHLEANRH